MLFNCFCRTKRNLEFLKCKEMNRENYFTGKTYLKQLCFSLINGYE